MKNKEKIRKEFKRRFGEDFYDLHVRACRIVDTDENKTQKWCDDHKEELIDKIIDFIITNED